MEKELFPLSWLSQYGYCPRRCGLLALDRAWIENADTAAGRVQHERVHKTRTERKDEDLGLYDLAVFSRKLGISGRCDCIEAKADEGGVPLPFGPGRYNLYPVEYKHGVIRNEEEYHIQLCGQAMCLEEMFDAVIPAGAIFFINAHRRDEVLFDEALRRRTVDTVKAIADLLEGSRVPEGNYGSKCKKCSMAEYCQPKRKRTAEYYCRKLLSQTAQEDTE